MLKPLGAFSLSSGSLFSAVASGGDGTGASFAAAGLLSGRPISGEPGGSAAAAGAAAGAGAAAAGAGAGAGAGVAVGAGAGSGAGAGVVAAAGACAGASCGCWASAVVARSASVAASNVPRGTRLFITFLPSTEVRSLPASLRTVSDISTPTCNRVAHDSTIIDRAFVRASHAPIGVRRVVPVGRKGRDLIVARRKMAGRIGGGGVAGERKGLAAAAAEIDIAPVAALARFFHPRRAAKSVERRRIFPDIGERMLAHRPEFEA